ncbi:hypothetical protein F3Y22_tig00110160pilonHSYRG00490 [Hibiscus syriacus]|uniref:Uncharacterized protein n=1 Tax=Hibiscus syriacus TaxID=106335 RepID=A0A6A3BLR4_HIBSY|nr:hypothetical protein F3Y22_tig00110160pilonHSYRG00490 [Hibiscus syriacus]
MSKAYDRVEWVFLKSVMLKLGFCEPWIGIVMSCITTVSYSVVANGCTSDYFTPSRGLRQGDPISLYLFLLCGEQGWRLLTNPSSLVAHLLRAKYFPNSSFLQDNRGASSFLIWCSLWSSRGLLEMGIGWTIGAGSTVSIWNDYCLPCLPSCRISSMRNNQLVMVSELMVPNEQKWDENLIPTVFDHEEVTARNLILSIPPSDILVAKDRWAAPPLSTYKINVDASYISSDKKNLARGLLEEIARVSLSGRNGNNPAHALAAEGLRRSLDHFWVEDAPDLVRNLAAKDRRFLELP